jgi:hypothetical protein
VIHKTTEQFWDRYDRLPYEVQKLAKKNFQLLKVDPKHPSLQFKKVGGFWSARVGLAYRVIAVEDGSNFIWVWIGNHSDYNKIIRKR